MAAPVNPWNAIRKLFPERIKSTILNHHSRIHRSFRSYPREPFKTAVTSISNINYYPLYNRSRRGPTCQLAFSRGLLDYRFRLLDPTKGKHRGQSSRRDRERERERETQTSKKDRKTLIISRRPFQSISTPTFRQKVTEGAVSKQAITKDGIN